MYALLSTRRGRGGVRKLRRYNELLALRQLDGIAVHLCVIGSATDYSPEI